LSLSHILVFSAFSLLAGWLTPRWRASLLFIGSLLAVYWLQPATPIRYLDFWFPTASILITMLVWAVTRQNHLQKSLFDLRQIIPILSFVVLVGLTRYLGPVCCLTATRPPDILQVIVACLLVAVLIAALLALHNRLAGAALALVLLVIIFILLKTESLAQVASAALRSLQGQDATLAESLDLRWLGFSYLAFRLLHVLRDFQLGKPQAASLKEFITYALFFPTLTAGPIDRSQRFVGELRSETHMSSETLFDGGQRILLGLFKKFVLADSLAIVALNPQNSIQTAPGVWAWVLLYAYTLRIYFDFAGYTDIALGMGRWLGIHLPENFTAPYFKTNLTAFWNSWHITLAQWFRAYFFNPLTRALRSGSRQLPVWLVIFIGQAGTMLLIGLWHGVTWNFAAWGLWHAIGLFLHNRWSDWVRPILGNLEQRPTVRRLASLGGWFLTFHYVTLGWVWFALPDLSLSLAMFHKLFNF
jgi:D-alanyl-lipoteichoic acid acyltransferase DltB (MBOAT superfamily)